MILNKVYTQEELRLAGIYTGDYQLNLNPGTYYGILDLKAEASRSNCLRLFFTMADGSKVFATAHWWQKYLGFYEIPVGTMMALRYEANSRGDVFLTAAVPVVEQENAESDMREPVPG